jgi:hypothetical protein
MNTGKISDRIEEKDSSDSNDGYDSNYVKFDSKKGHKSAERPVWDDNKRVRTYVYVVNINTHVI